MNRRWIVLSLVFIGIVICYIDRGNLSVAAPSIMRDFRIAPATMGVLLSAFFWTYAAFQIPAGAMVDRFGIRRAYAGGFLIWSIASAAIALSRGPGDIIGMRMALGLAESIAPLASISFIRNNFAGKDQGLPTSIYIAGQNVGPALGAIVGAILLDRFGWRMMFAITGLGGLVWLPGWLAAAPHDGTRAERQAKKAADDLAAPRLWTWRMLLTKGTFWAMSLSISFSSYYWYFVLTWVPSYLILARGFSTLEMGRVVSTALFTMAVVNVGAGAVVDKLAARIGVFRARVLFAALGYAGTAAILLLLDAGSVLGTSYLHVFDVRDRHRQFELLDDFATRAAEEPGRADHRIPEHALLPGRRGGACYYRADTRTAKAFRAGDFRRRRLPCPVRRLLAGRRIQGA